MGKALLLTNHI